MPSFARRLIGLLLILTTVGVTAWQTLAVSCSSPVAAGGIPASASGSAP